MTRSLLFLTRVPFVVISNTNEMTVDNHHGNYSYMMLTENDMCLDLFSPRHCWYIRNILKVVVREIEQKSEQEKSILELRMEQEKSEFEEERTIFADEIRHVKQELELMKKQLNQSIQCHNETHEVVEHKASQTKTIFPKYMADEFNVTEDMYRLSNVRLQIFLNFISKKILKRIQDQIMIFQLILLFAFILFYIEKH